MTRWLVPGFFRQRPYSPISLAFSLSSPFILELHRTAIIRIEDCEHAFSSGSDAPMASWIFASRSSSPARLSSYSPTYRPSWNSGERNLWSWGEPGGPLRRPSPSSLLSRMRTSENTFSPMLGEKAHGPGQESLPPKRT